MLDLLRYEWLGTKALGMTTDEAKRRYIALMVKIERFTEARRIAEQYLRRLQANPRDWEDFCDVNGLSVSCDLGDLTC